MKFKKSELSNIVQILIKIILQVMLCVILCVEEAPYLLREPLIGIAVFICAGITMTLLHPEYSPMYSTLSRKQKTKSKCRLYYVSC